MGLYINGQNLAKPYINGQQYNAYLNGQKLWSSRITKGFCLCDNNQENWIYSLDGINWNTGTKPNNYYNSLLVWGVSGWFSIRIYVLNTSYYLGLETTGTLTQTYKTYYTNDHETGTKNYITMPYDNTYKWFFCNIGYTKYVAIATNLVTDSYAYSSDGSNWTGGKLPFSAKWTYVVSYNGRFVAFATDHPDKIIYSDNGINWTIINIPNNITWKTLYIAISI